MGRDTVRSRFGCRAHRQSPTGVGAGVGGVRRLRASTSFARSNSGCQPISGAGDACTDTKSYTFHTETVTLATLIAPADPATSGRLISGS